MIAILGHGARNCGPRNESGSDGRLAGQSEAWPREAKFSSGKPAGAPGIAVMAVPGQEFRLKAKRT